MLVRYLELENDDLKQSLACSIRVLCGGRHRDPLHWTCSDNINVGATCGRTAPSDQLASCGFTQSRERRIFWCEHCGSSGGWRRLEHSDGYDARRREEAVSP